MINNLDLKNNKTSKYIFSTPQIKQKPLIIKRLTGLNCTLLATIYEPILCTIKGTL